HRLVKDYKLVKESLNDPVADARQAAVLFQDEFRALGALCQTEPEVFELLRFLLATGDEPGEPLAQGMHILFEVLGRSKVQSPRPKVQTALEGPPDHLITGSQDAAIEHPASRIQHHVCPESFWGSRFTFHVSRLFSRWGCASVPVDDSLLQTASNRLAVAYV